MQTKALLASLLFAASAMAAPTELATRQTSCAPLQLVFLVGTSESGLGSPSRRLFLGEYTNSPPSIAAKQSLRTYSATTYSVPYDTKAEYSTTVKAGATATAQYINDQVARCPNQLFALGGYSKGAMVVHTTSLTTALKNKVIGIVVFGDPYRSSSNTWPITSPVVDSAPRDGSTASQNVASFCNSGDLFCDGGSSLPAHLAYGTDGSTTIAATFLKNKYTARA
ncbi:hypothetical protein FRC07_008264 [Ceratobasidium sp. 392]|nr:hypothetical protein FRC07_008264 [Ceratobasidium sp. 392]